MFDGQGTLRYREGSWATIWMDKDDDIAKYYRSIIRTPGYHKMMAKPLYRPHITVVNGRHEPQASSSLAWGKYEGETVSFTYSGDISFSKGKWFIKCECIRMGDIRVELGLSRIFAVRPPHITIARIVKDPAKGKILA